MSACVDAGEGEGQSEICNALLNYIVYCNVSCIALRALHMYSNRGNRHIRNAFIIIMKLLLISYKHNPLL